MRKNKISFVLNNIVTSWEYLYLFVFVSLLFYVINIIIGNFSNFVSFYRSFGLIAFFQFFFTVIIGYGKTIPLYSFIILLILSFLTGIFITLLTYRFKLERKDNNEKLGIFASTGLFLGILAPGCASCGIGLVALLGLSSSFAILPFKGLEISILAIFFLLFSIIKITNSYSRSCDFNLKKLKINNKKK